MCLKKFPPRELKIKSEGFKKEVRDTRNEHTTG